MPKESRAFQGLAACREFDTSCEGKPLRADRSTGRGRPVPRAIPQPAANGQAQPKDFAVMKASRRRDVTAKRKAKLKAKRRRQRVRAGH